MKHEEKTESTSAFSIYGPKGLLPTSSGPFIIAPDHISGLLMSSLEHTDEELLLFLNQLIDLIEQCPYNSLLLFSRNTPAYLRLTANKDFDLIIAIIERLFESNKRVSDKKKVIKNCWMKLLKCFSACWCLRQHYESVYKTISQIIASCVKDEDVLENSSAIFTAAKMLLQITGPQTSTSVEPQNYFYFMPISDSLSAVIPHNSLWPFHKGFTIAMWIKPFDSGKPDMITPVLFRFRSSTKGFECYIINSVLHYRILSLTYARPSSDSNGIAVGELAKNKWQFVALSQDKTGNISKFHIFVGTDDHHYVIDYPKFPEDETIIEHTLFENFAGTVSSVLIFNHPLPQMTISTIAATFPYGVYDSKYLELLASTALTNQYCAWTPLRIHGNAVYNLFNNSKMTTAILLGNSGIFLGSKEKRYLDPISNIMPFYHICNLLNEKKSRKLLNLALRLTFNYFRNLDESALLAVRKQKGFKLFMEIFGYHVLHMNPQVPNEETIKILGDIMLINPYLQKAMLQVLLDTVNFWTNINTNMLTLFWETLKANFACDPKQYSHIVSVSSILRCMEAMDLSLNGISCCEKHPRNKNRLSFGRTSSASEREEKHGFLNLRYESMRSLLKFIIINESNKATKSIQNIMSVLEQKPCPCLFLALLLLLKDLCEGNSTFTKMIDRIDGITNILKFSQSYSVDIKVICLSFATVVIKQSKILETFEMREFKKNLILMLIEHNERVESRPSQEEEKKSENILRKIKRSISFYPYERKVEPVVQARRKLTIVNEHSNVPLLTDDSEIHVKVRTRAKSVIQEKGDLSPSSHPKQGPRQSLFDSSDIRPIPGLALTEEPQKKNSIDFEEFKGSARENSIGNTHSDLIDIDWGLHTPPSLDKSGPASQINESPASLMRSLRSQMLTRSQTGAVNMSTPSFKNIDVEILYLAIMQWMLGNKPEIVLNGKREKLLLSVSQEQKINIINSHIISILVAYVKKLNTEELLRRFLSDLTMIAEKNSDNRQHLMNSKHLKKLLIWLEGMWYGQLTNSDKATGSKCSELLRTAFKLHLTLLCEGLKNMEGMNLAMTETIIWNHTIHPESANTSRTRSGSLGSVRDVAMVEHSWSCLKFIWMNTMKLLIPIIEDPLSKRVYSAVCEQTIHVIECTLHLIISHNYKKGQGIHLAKETNPFGFLEMSSDNSKQFKVSDLELIDVLFDLISVYWQENTNPLTSQTLFNKFCKERALDEQIKMLESSKKVSSTQAISKENGLITTSVITLHAVIRNVVNEDDLSKWLNRAERCAKYIMLVIEYANVVGNTKVLRSENKNLLLLIMSLLSDFCSEHRREQKDSQKMIGKTLGSIFQFIYDIANVQQGFMHEFVKKTLGMAKSKYVILIDNVYKFTRTNEEEYEGLLRNEYKALFSSLNSSRALDRVSDASLEIIKSDFKRTAETMKAKLKEQKAGFFKPKTIPKPKLRKGSSPKSDEYKQDEMDNLLRLEKNFRLWIRKWTKVQKRIRQWQGAWRDRNFFDTSNNTKLPLKLSSHLFSNGCRCLMKIRCKKTNCIDPSTFPETQDSALRSETTFKLFTSVTILNTSNYDFLSESNMTKHGMIQGINFLPLKNRAGNYAVDMANLLHKMIPSPIKDYAPTPTDCEIYTPLCAKKGKILMHYDEVNSHIKFVYANEKMGDDERLMFSFVHDYETKLVKKWKLREIRVIYKKYIVDQRSAIEVVLYSGKAVLFNFAKEEERDLFCTRLLKFRDKTVNDAKFECVPKGAKSYEKVQLLEDWLNWRVSTFDYLMILNNLSGRSYNNVSQYPVFPWIIDDHISETLKINEKTIYRDLTKNLGMLGEKQRAEDYKSKYDLEDLTGMGRFHFGSHYSNPGIVFQYLMRVFPFVEAYIKFFSGLDDPNRMFHSVSESLLSAKRDASDVRELIPEFFSFPDILINREGFIFGVREDDMNKVNHVVLPPWSKGSPFTYISIMREALESNIAATTISHWIDLIFGFQQQGKEAEKAFNVFPKLSYEPAKILIKTNEAQKAAYRMQAFHWGQTPLQLFNKKHPERPSKQVDKVYSLFDQNAKPNSYTPEIHKDNPKVVDNPNKHGKIIKISTTDENSKDPSFMLITLEGLIIDIVVEVTEQEAKHKESKSASLCFVDSAPKKYQNHYMVNGTNLLDPQISHNFPVAVIRKRGIPHIAQGGYINGNIQLTQISKVDKVQTLHYHSSTVTCLEVDRDERFAISGDISGDVVLYMINDKCAWIPQRSLHDHNDSITFVHISDEMQLFVTASLDGTANLYTRSANPKLLRTFRHPRNLPIHYALLSQNPLPCLVIYSKDDSTFYCFCFNGEIISKDSDTTRNIIGITIGHDSNFCDYLLYIKDKDYILAARKLPSLERKLLVSRKWASTFSLFESQRMAVIGDDYGSFALIWDPNSICNNQNKIISIP